MAASKSTVTDRSRSRPPAGARRAWAPPTATRVRVGQIIKRTILYTVLCVIAALFLIPFYLIIRNSLMTNEQITSFTWQWIPSDPQWSNFTGLFKGLDAHMGTGLRNSAIIAVITFALSTLFSSMAGYALARIRFRWRNGVFFVIMLSLMVPTAVTFVPTFVVVASMGGISTLWGIIAPGLFNAFATFLFRQFYLGFPTEMEDAGRIDGLGYWGIYRRLLLPNSIGIIMALGILAFINSWNAFLWPLVIGQSQSSWTVQVVLSTYLTSQTIELGPLFAAAAIGVVPLVGVFLVMQRYIVEGVKLQGNK